jgi:hypothetical protein
MANKAGSRQQVPRAIPYSKLLDGNVTNGSGISNTFVCDPDDRARHDLANWIVAIHEAELVDRGAERNFESFALL